MQDVLGADTTILQLGGGIARYLEEYGGSGYFRGKHYVFDHRQVEDPRLALKRKAVPQEHAEAEGQGSCADVAQGQEDILSTCFACGKPWDDTQGQRRCSIPGCRMPLLVCKPCQSRKENRDLNLLCELCATGRALPQNAQTPREDEDAE